jgi:tellurite resistance protein TerC
MPVPAVKPVPAQAWHQNRVLLADGFTPYPKQFGPQKLEVPDVGFILIGDEKIDTANHPAVRFASRFFPLTPKVEGHNFFTKIGGRTYMTPLFLVLLVIEFSDIIFAVDSIPAVFSVTTDPFIVYFSNIFAIMGLRSLFFLLSDITDKFWLLKYGLGALLCFIGIKMIGHEFFGLSISTMASLMIILGILVFSILFSLIFPRKSRSAAPVE